jgi:MoxR-like ATPase
MKGHILFLKLISYPSPEDEKKIFSQETSSSPSRPASENIKPKEFIEIQQYIAKNIQVDSKIYDYISDILEATRGRHL